MLCVLRLDTCVRLGKSNRPEKNCSSRQSLLICQKDAEENLYTSMVINVVSSLAA
jgi:hypothetical protein